MYTFGHVLRRGSPVFIIMEYLDFESLTNDLKNINSQQKYWMIRTMGGAYYGDFIRNDYVAVGYNEIPLEFLRKLPDTEAAAKTELKAFFINQFPNTTNTGYPVAQLLRFTREIRQGDIVIIPSSNAAHVAIGIIRGDMYEEEHPQIDSEHRCGFKKRRKVDWKFSGRRSALPPALQLMFNSRHILSDVTNYAPFVDSVINDFYVKDDIYNLVLRIRTQKDVSLDDFCDLKAISILIDNFCKIHGIPSDGSLVMKIQMESPGWLKLSTAGIKKLLLFGLFSVAINGGGIEYDKEKGLNIHTDGLIGAINNYLDREADRELVRAAARAMDSLQIKQPEDLQPIIEMLNAKNEGREKY